MKRKMFLGLCMATFIAPVAMAMAIWHTKIKNYPLALRYQVNLPMIPNSPALLKSAIPRLASPCERRANPRLK